MITTYQTDTTNTGTSPCNVHLRQVGVAPNLHLLGAGGSIPGFRHGKQCWGSFPYASDQEFAKDLTRVLDPFFFPETSSSLGKQDAVILMTHNGPDQSSMCDTVIICSIHSLILYLCCAITLLPN